MLRAGRMLTGWKFVFSKGATNELSTKQYKSTPQTTAAGTLYVVLTLSFTKRQRRSLSIVNFQTEQRCIANLIATYGERGLLRNIAEVCSLAGRGGDAARHCFAHILLLSACCSSRGDAILQKANSMLPSGCSARLQHADTVYKDTEAILHQDLSSFTNTQRNMWCLPLNRWNHVMVEVKHEQQEKKASFLIIIHH